MRALLVEDEDPKRQHIHKFCGDTFPRLVLHHTGSVRGAIDIIRDDPPDLILLDMSLPTFDIATKERGNRPQGAGGIEIVRYIEMMEVNVPIIIVTAYPAIGIDGHQLSLEQVDEFLRQEYSNNYKGLVYFNSVYGSWQSDLEAKMREVGVL